MIYHNRCCRIFHAIWMWKKERSVNNYSQRCNWKKCWLYKVNVLTLQHVSSKIPYDLIVIYVFLRNKLLFHEEVASIFASFPSLIQILLTLCDDENDQIADLANCCLESLMRFDEGNFYSQCQLLAKSLWEIKDARFVQYNKHFVEYVEHGEKSASEHTLLAPDLDIIDPLLYDLSDSDSWPIW